MNRKLKAVGLALVAVFAMSAVMASGAQGAAGKFTASSYPAAFTGTQVVAHKFATTPGNVTCSGAAFSGEQAAATENLTVKAVYSGCLLGGLVEAKVNMKSCDYVFHAGLTVTTNGPIAGTVDVECSTANDEIAVTNAAGCEILIPQQTGLSKVEYTNNTGTGDVTVNINVTGIKYTETKPCIKGETETKVTTNGVYTGTATISGTGKTVSVDEGS